MRRAVLAFAALLLGVAACARAESRTNPLAIEAGVPIDTELMAYLSLARSRHHEANLEEDDDVPGAIGSLNQLVAAPRPHPSSNVPEIEEVLADTYARLAELELRRQGVNAAAEDVRQGLTHAKEPTYFRGHLLEMGGLAEEAREGALRDAGSTAAATAARQKAIDLFHQAVAVQEQVVKDSLRSDAGNAGGGK
jgi:hypothetical protein